ncbi:MAG: hypothetical protein ACYC2O_02330 [Microthrixaceae bacterium]
MARSTGVGASVSGGARTGPDEPAPDVPPVVRRKRDAADTPPGRRGRVTRSGTKQPSAKQTTSAKKASAKKASAKKTTPAKQPGTKQSAAATTSGTQGSPAAAAVSSARGIARIVVPPDTDGPRVRTGVLWFFLALAAATSGRPWTAALWAVVAGVAGYQLVTVWQQALATGDGDRDGEVIGGGAARLCAAVLAAALPAAASYGTGTAGALLIAAPLIAMAVHALLGQRPGEAAPTVIGIVLPGIAAIAVVLAVRVDLWAGLFLILAVSLYDAGSFLLGADAGGRWEGPVAGMIGAFAVTFTMATFQPPPFDRTEAWVAGTVIVLCCPLGQWLASAFLPSADTRATAVRRMDAYLVAAPAFVVVAWFAA